MLVLGWHRPSEVIGAYLVAVAWTALAAAVLLAARGPGELAASRGRRARAGAAVAAALAIAFAVVAVVAAERRLDVRATVGDRTSLAAAAAVCMAACAGAVALMTGMLQRVRRTHARRRAG